MLKIKYLFKKIKIKIMLERKLLVLLQVNAARSFDMAPLLKICSAGIERLRFVYNNLH